MSAEKTAAEKTAAEKTAAEKTGTERTVAGTVRLGKAVAAKIAAGNWQLTTVVQRLAALLNPLRPVRALRAGTRAPLGEPDRLRELAAAFRATAAELAPLPAALSRLPASGDRRWDGLVAESAAQVRTAASVAVAEAPAALQTAAAAMDELADQITAQQRRHAELRAAARAGGIAARLRALVRGYRALHDDALVAADRAAAVFADVAGQARVAAGVAGGLDPCDAVVLAGMDVRIPGVGDGYDDGVLSPAQLRSAGARLSTMSAGERAQVRELLAAGASEVERAYLVKAVAAGHPAAELATFAAAIAGQNATWLYEHLSLLDRGGVAAQRRFGVAVNQYDPYTCGTTSLIMARAEADPVYALRLTAGEPAAFDARLSAEQATVHDETNLVYPRRWGTTPQGVVRWLNSRMPDTGVRCRWRLVDDTDRPQVSRALREVVTAVDAGYCVPLLVGGVVPRHYVLAVGHSGGALLIFEPSRGVTVRVTVADFVGGALREEAGFDHVQALILPTGLP